MEGEKKNISTKIKNLIYRLTLWIFPFIILLMVEILLRLFGYGHNFNLFIEHPDERFRKYKICNPSINFKYFQNFENNIPPDDMFLKEKPANGYRIFVLGSSTVIGFPYDQNLMFSRILQERLKDSYPNKNIEVVNTALTAISSYSLLDYMDDILKEKPDAILYYEGHNEFYGALGVGSNENASKYRKLTLLHLELLNLRIYQLLRDIITRIKTTASGEKSSDIKGTLMGQIAGNEDIVYKGEIYNLGIKQFKDNVTEILRKARDKHVPVYISEVVSNIRDLKPFSSVESTQYPLAINVFNKAKEYEKQGEYQNAKKYYYQAKDLDGIRFRASEEINEIIRQLADEYNAYLVSMKSHFEKKSPNGIMGNSLFTEHVHPNIDGCFLMADVFYNKIVSTPPLSKSFNIVYYKNSDYYRKNWGYSLLDSLYGVHKTSILKSFWPFRPIDDPNEDNIRCYKPGSFIDSLAFLAAISPDANIPGAHLKIADYYKNKMDYYNAFKEYYSFIKCTSYYAEVYLNAANCLILTDDLPMALKLIEESLKLEETYAGYSTKGALLLSRSDYKAALDAFNKASKLVDNPADKETLLSGQFEAYYYNGQIEKSKVVLKELQSIKPNYKPNLDADRINYAFVVPYQVKDQVNRAIKYYREGNLDAALTELLESLKIKETAVANKLTGEILMNKNDKKAIIYLLRAYPEFKNDINILSNICILYLNIGKIEEARGALEKIRNLNPNHPNVKKIENLFQNLPGKNINSE